MNVGVTLAVVKSNVLRNLMNTDIFLSVDYIKGTVASIVQVIGMANDVNVFLTDGVGIAKVSETSMDFKTETLVVDSSNLVVDVSYVEVQDMKEANCLIRDRFQRETLDEILNLIKVGYKTATFIFRIVIQDVNVILGFLFDKIAVFGIKDVYVTDNGILKAMNGDVDLEDNIV